MKTVHSIPAMSANRLNAFLFAVLLAVASGCSHTVSYKLTEQDSWTGPKIEKVGGVVPLTDHTPQSTNKVLRFDDANWRTNYRKGYKSAELATNVTAMLVKHLAHSGLFKKVVLGGEQACDLQLSGTLKDYMAMGRIHSTAEGIEAGTAGFGLIGALIGAATTAKMDTEIRASVKLDDLELIDTATQSPIWTGTVCLSNNFSANFLRQIRWWSSTMRMIC